MMTTRVKMTAAMGVLNEVAMALAAAAPGKGGVGTAEIEIWPKPEPSVAPRCTAGPYRPTGAQADGAGANERCGDAFALGMCVVIDAGDNGVGGPWPRGVSGPYNSQ